jgi:hypothetical protein
MLAALVAIPTLLVLLAAGPAGEDIYTWTDSAGTAHYTNDPNTIPQAYRDKARTLEGQPVPSADAPAKSPANTDAEEMPKVVIPKPVDRSSDGFEESAPPPPAPTASAAAALDEAAWRKLFLKTNERVRRAELNLARDQEQLSRVSNEEGYLVVDAYGRTMSAGRSTALRMQVAEDERVLNEARDALSELERAAALQAIPLEWRH